METVVFVAAALVCLAGAVGVVLSDNPVHSALSLVGTLFGIAVLFIAQDAEFLAAVQIIVYAGAIVVVFLFVIMLLGVDRTEDIRVEPLAGQRAAAAVVAGLLFVGISALVVVGSITGKPSTAAPNDTETSTVTQLADLLFTRYLWAFEITSVLLVIGVVGAVVLARHRREAYIDDDPADDAAALPGGAA